MAPEDQPVALSQLRLMCISGEARRMRQLADVTLGEIARSIGSTATTVSRWERGKDRPTGDAALRYLRLLARLGARFPHV